MSSHIIPADVQYGEELDNGYLRLNEATQPLVCFIDNIHPSKFPKKLSYVTKLKARTEELTGLPCIVVRYTQLAGADMTKPNIRAILIDASLGPMNPPDQEYLYKLIVTTTIPTMGFCGGHHLVYNAYGVLMNSCGNCTQASQIHIQNTNPAGSRNGVLCLFKSSNAIRCLRACRTPSL